MPDDASVPDDRIGEPTGGPAADDEFANLVLDERFIRGGAYEAPARTRLAIARYGDQQTSWRHGGWLSNRRPGEQPRAPEPRPRRRSRPAPSGRPMAPSPLLAKLPIIITVVVVVVAAFLMFR